MHASPSPIDTAPSSSRISVWFWLFGAMLIVYAAVFVVMTWHWPMVGDAALMHYTVFLIHHGWAPYRDILDINMPGAYWATDLGTRLAPSRDVSWRIFDFGLIGLAGLGYFMIARPYSRFAALFATVMLLLVHGQDGVQQAGQRDLVMAVLLVVAVGFLLEAMRKERSAYLVPFGLAVGMSATIKPTAAPFGLVLLMISATYRAGLWGRTWKPQRAEETREWLTFMLIGIASIGLPLACMLLWLVHKQALDAWLMTERVFLPYYASLGRLSLGHLLLHSISPVALLVLLWLVCAALRGPTWPRFERVLVAAAALFSLLALLAQAKPLPYHRYPLMAFLLLLIAIDLVTAWQRSPAVGRNIARYVALAGLCYGCLVIAPRSLIKVHHFVAKPQEFDAMLAADLRTVGGDLNRRVQCLDTINECVPTLDSMGLEPATGFLYDLNLFGSKKQAPVREVQERFFNEVQKNPPAVFVVVSGYFLEDTGGYQKLQAWPEFEQWLNAHYTLAEERVPPHAVRWWGRSQRPAGYRMYVRNPVTAVANPLPH